VRRDPGLAIDPSSTKHRQAINPQTSGSGAADQLPPSLSHPNAETDDQAVLSFRSGQPPPGVAPSRTGRNAARCARRFLPVAGARIAGLTTGHSYSSGAVQDRTDRSKKGAQMAAMREARVDPEPKNRMA